MTREIHDAIIDLIESADSEGCTDDLTVVNASAVDKLGDIILTEGRPEPQPKTASFTDADAQTVRDLVLAFEEHLKQEAAQKKVEIERVCPCWVEIDAARILLERLKC